MRTTLKESLKKYGAGTYLRDFAEDLTLEEFLVKCERGDWILWLFMKSNPSLKRELALAKGHCANTVRHLTQDKRCHKAIDIAIKFGEGEVDEDVLEAVAVEAESAHNTAYNASYRAAAIKSKEVYLKYLNEYISADAAHAAVAYADANPDHSVYTFDANAAYSAAYGVAYHIYTPEEIQEKQKETADICRKYLPLKIWNKLTKTTEK